MFGVCAVASPPFFMQAVAVTLTARYVAVVDETLTTVRKTEMSLKRLKGRRGGGDAEGEGSTTDQMLCRQLLLDVQVRRRLVWVFSVACGVCLHH